MIDYEDPGTYVVATEFGTVGMDRADALVGVPVPEKRAGNGFPVLFSQRPEEVLFIRVHGDHTFLSIGVHYPEFTGSELFPDTDNLPHGTATVTAALAYEGQV
jgi:hypothetical protein